MLLIVIPILLLVPAERLFESDADKLGIGLVNLDRGISIPGGLSMRLGDSIEQGIREVKVSCLLSSKNTKLKPSLKQ